MRRLLPSAEGTGDEGVSLHDFYGDRLWLRRGGVRLNFISSVDGSIAVGGASAPLQTPGDNRVFQVLRDLADVVLVGAGTARTEGYRALNQPPERQRLRVELGLPAQLRIAIVSNRLDLDPGSPLFTGSEVPPIVLTCTSADPARRAALSAVADVLDCGGDRVRAELLPQRLRELQLVRILCEGGPQLFGSLAAAGVADELCLTLSPLITTSGTGRIIASAAGAPDVRLRLTGLLEEDGALFCRYRLGAARPGGTDQN